jgi:hypothetical protein
LNTDSARRKSQGLQSFDDDVLASGIKLFQLFDVDVEGVCASGHEGFLQKFASAEELLRGDLL